MFSIDHLSWLILTETQIMLDFKRTWKICFYPTLMRQPAPTTRRPASSRPPSWRALAPACTAPSARSRAERSDLRCCLAGLRREREEKRRFFGERFFLIFENVKKFFLSYVKGRKDFWWDGNDGLIKTYPSKSC
jgi:hypothetical protein